MNAPHTHTHTHIHTKAGIDTCRRRRKGGAWREEQREGAVGAVAGVA